MHTKYFVNENRYVWISTILYKYKSTTFIYNYIIANDIYDRVKNKGDLGGRIKKDLVLSTNFVLFR